MPPGQVFFRPAVLKNLAIHKVLTAIFCLAGQKNLCPFGMLGNLE
jgi:hypothetical protein